MKMLFRYGLLLYFAASLAQAPAVSWMKRYGGSDFEIFSSLISTSDGGFTFGGYSGSGISGNKTESEIGYNADYWMLKTDAGGTVQWQKTIGGGMPNMFGDLGGEVLKTIRPAADGGYFLGGNSDSPVFGLKTVPNYGGQDFWIVKTDAVGTPVWQADMGGSEYDECYALEATPDGGCIVGGYSLSGISGNKTDASRGLSDYWVVKLDAGGQVQWQKAYGGSSADILYSITVLDNQEYLLTGVSASNISGDKTQNSKGGGDFWIIQIDANGTILWQKTIGGNSIDEPFRALKTTDGFIICGSSGSNISFDKSEICRGGNDFWIVKTDFEGNVIWDRTYGGDQDDNGNDMALFPDGSGILIAGSSYSGISGDKTMSNYGANDGWAVRLDSNGNLLWQKGIGGPNAEGFNEVVVLPNKSIVLGGGSSSPISGDITVDGYGSIDYLLVKLEPEVLGITTLIKEDFHIYPNPVNDSLTMNFNENQQLAKVIIYNSLGQVVKTTEFFGVLNASIPFDEPAGLYYVKAEDAFGNSNQSVFLKK